MIRKEQIRKVQICENARDDVPSQVKCLQALAGKAVRNSNPDRGYLCFFLDCKTTTNLTAIERAIEAENSISNITGFTMYSPS